MTRKIIFFDIDGTLLNEDKQLPSSTKGAVKQLQEAGHHVAIATGRAPFMFEAIRKELEIETYISYNGQYVVSNGEEVFKNALNREKLEALTELAVSNNHPVVFMDREDMKANVPHHDHIIESIESLKVGKLPTHDPHYHRENDIFQSLLFCQQGEEVDYEKEFKAFTFTRWHPLSVDIIPAGGSKAQGIEKLVSHLGYEKENVYAFGDGLNDIEMLSEVYHSVAMGDGHIEAKNAAKYVTKAVDEDGIVYGLKMVGLLE